MFQSIRKAIISKWLRYPYIGCFVALLLTSMLLSGCPGLGSCVDDGARDSSTIDREADEMGREIIRAIIHMVAAWGNKHHVTPGDRVDSTLSAIPTSGEGLNAPLLSSLASGEVSSVNFIWMPSPDVEDICFLDHQPVNPDGPPPYEFNDVPLDEYGEANVRVTYVVPSLPLGREQMLLVDTLQVEHAGGVEAASAILRVHESPPRTGMPFVPSDALPSAPLTTSGTSAIRTGRESLPQERPIDPSIALRAGLAQDRWPELLVGRMAPQQDYHLWEIHQWFDPGDVTMTATLCQDWVDFLQEGTTFVALRFPDLSATPPYTGSYALPVVFRGEYSPTLHLLDDRGGGPGTAILTAPLEYKPERFTFLENELPSAEEEHWLALGIPSSPPITCPEGLEIGGEDWNAEFEAWLDFGGEEGACKDCVLPLYYCYEGDEASFSSALVARAHGAGLGATSYQGWGITCMGPHPLRLRGGDAPDPAFVLYGMHTANISPPQTISFSHAIKNLGSDPVAVTLDYTSSLGVPWGIYSGTEDGPDLPLVPITGSFTLSPELEWPANTRHFWMIAEVPTGAQGAETLLITATDVTSPALSTWTSDLLWVGDWVAPPPPPSCNELSDVALVGSPTTTVGIATTFTATTSPPTATLPVTYTWEAIGQTPTTHTAG